MGELAMAEAPITLSAVLEPLWALAALPAEATGMLACGVNGSSNGAIFVEAGRICWVAAQELKHRLTDLLAQHTTISGPALQQFYERCRAQSLPVGQTLVSQGLIDPMHLRSALCRHSAESLLSLSGAGQPWRWIPRASRGYQAQFTFDSVEMLLAAAATFHPEAQSAAIDELGRFTGLGRAAAFVYDGVDAVPVAVSGAPFGLRELLSLGSWALQVPAAAGEMGYEPEVTLARTRDGRGVAVWQRGTMLLTVTCEDQIALGAVMSRHMAR